MKPTEARRSTRQLGSRPRVPPGSPFSPAGLSASPPTRETFATAPRMEGTQLRPIISRLFL